MDDTKHIRRISVQLADPMRHFSRESAIVKLIALMVCQLPGALAALGVALLLVGKVFSWW